MNTYWKIANTALPVIIAIKVHNTLTEIIPGIAMRAGQTAIALRGGFQNACLLENASAKLKSASFHMYSHEKIPSNDSDRSLGQLYATQYMG